MNEKKTKLIILIGAIILVFILGYIIFSNISFTTPEGLENIAEYTPQEEITDEQLRQTKVLLYFNNKENNQLMPEARMIDSKLLLNPYDTLINLIIASPKNESMETVIPKDTKLIKTQLKGDVVYVDVSKEFIENHPGGEENEKKTIDAMVNTLTQLNEVNGLKILIDGEENKAFLDGKINFEKVFSVNYKF